MFRDLLGCAIRVTHVVGVAQLVEHRVVAPVVEGSIPFTHPIFSCFDSSHAPVAQLDRVPDFESVGRRFESCRAYHFVTRLTKQCVGKNSDKIAKGLASQRQAFFAFWGCFFCAEGQLSVQSIFQGEAIKHSVWFFLDNVDANVCVQ